MFHRLLFKGGVEEREGAIMLLSGGTGERSLPIDTSLIAPLLTEILLCDAPINPVSIEPWLKVLWRGCIGQFMVGMEERGSEENECGCCKWLDMGHSVDGM